ncbi:RHS repeat-associated core domain-containing protein, partial [Aliikangiella sp. G2MR2-5]|uniref:RHS repeat-associated core domain-containing protein n=1 Tax=Aliikangiella sp. G2MR2-5 TaxID=2788943 RepID=UPI0027385E70
IETYQYDELQRLINANNSQETTIYRYDAIGNRSSRADSEKSSILSYANQSSLLELKDTILDENTVSSIETPNLKYKLEEAAGSQYVYDSIAGDFGTVYGGVTLEQAGSPDSARSAYFNGATGSFIKLGNWKISTATVEAWVKTSDAGAGSRAIVAKKYAYGVFMIDNELMVYDYKINKRHYTGIRLNDDKWHHIIFSFQGGVENGSSLYVDGEKVLSLTYSIRYHTENLTIGAGTMYGNSHNFKGLIDDVAIFNQVLTPEQVSERYAAKGETVNTAFTYDPNGNTIQKGEFTFSYNDANRMATSSVGGLVTNYQYNAKGERSVKTRSGVETHYIFDLNGQLIAEADGNGNIQKEYVYFNGQPFAQVIGDDVYFYHNSHLGAPELMTDANQNIVWQASHTPFGLATVTNETIVNNIRFPGQYYDDESGLHYNYFRDYDPEIGRYIQSDPIGLAGGINTYGYVLGNPVMYSDPYGLCVGILCPTRPVPPGGGSSADLSKQKYDPYDIYSPDPSDWSKNSGVSSPQNQLGGGATLDSDVQSQLFGESPFADFWGTNPFGDDGDEDECANTHEHHSDPKFLGGKPNQPLTRMSDWQHRQLHRDMNKFLRDRVNQNGHHMRPQSNNPGSAIREHFTRKQRLEALRDFYRGPGSRYTQAAKDFFSQHPHL